MTRKLSTIPSYIEYFRTEPPIESIPSPAASFYLLCLCGLDSLDVLQNCRRLDLDQVDNTYQDSHCSVFLAWGYHSDQTQPAEVLRKSREGTVIVIL